MKKLMNESYESPQVEIIEVEVEQGFAQSLEGVNNVGEDGFWEGI